MRKAAIEGRKRDEIEQFTALANLRRPKPGGEWPDPVEVDATELAIARASDPAELEQRRDALLEPPWKAAHHLFPPRAGDPWPRADHSNLAVLRRHQMEPYVFRRRGAAELYRAAWFCRKGLIAIANAPGTGAFGTS